MKYIIIIGDIINSKNISNRQIFQENLKNYLYNINKEYDKYLVSNFTVTLGDEFQAVFNDSKYIFEIIDKIQFFINPIKIRFGIGIGNIITNIDKNLSIGSDGPGYWNARKCIDKLRKYHERGIKDITNIMIKGIDNESLELLLNQIINLLSILKRRWTTNQNKMIEFIVNNYGYYNDFLQIDLSKELNIDSSSVNRRLKYSKFYDYLNSILIISKIINKEIK